MLSKEYVEQLLKILETDEKKIRDQIVHLNGQLVYNQKIFQGLRQAIDEDSVGKPPKSSKASSKKKR